ncbi:MAG: biosynthetic-type acetolactate synthase large subunit [Synergistaceae bacterium]|jgi:acetolactate synthase-1/2/3 large subunit|nr:biosynthetic-type acetolactate synthase large subunit [Synergistaceae bacterium]
MELTGAQIMVKSLEDEGVETVFGIPGGMVIPLYDALYDSSITQILVRHEQAAAHAADGYSRAGDKVGVCIATSGPGATNLVTGIATAYMDSSPMVAITGQVATGSIGTDAFQEAHILGISLPIVKHSMQIRSPDEITQTLRDAMFIASTGRPGPVVVDFPSDIQRGKGVYSRPSGLSFPGYSAELQENLEKLDEAAAMIRSAERPVVIAGNGVNISRAFGQLKNFCEKLELPVATSLLGKGSIAGDHPNSIGMVGMHGNAVVNRALDKADIVVIVGSRLSDRSTGKQVAFARQARVIHIDLDAAEIHKSIDADLWLIGDAGKIMDLLTEKASGRNFKSRAAWMEELRRMEADEPLGRRAEKKDCVYPWQVIDALDDVVKGEAIVTTEVGQHQMWTALYHRATHPRRFLTSGGLGTMGFGLPASIGAHFARPDLPIFCIAGDGSAMMNIQELDTYARYSLPVKVLLFDNNCLGMVRQWQQLFYDERFSNTIYSRRPDYVKIAQGMGVEAFTADDPANLRRSIERAVGTPGPVLIHIPIPQDENVFPMVPAGASLSEMLLAGI